MEKKHHISKDILDDTANSVEPALSYSCLPESSCEQTVIPEALSHSLTNDRNIYREDVVQHTDRGALLGVVVEVAGDSDSDGSITDESDIVDNVDGNNADDGVDAHIDDKNNESGADDELPDGKVRVLWTDGSESTDNINNVKVVDRRFMHGDVVAFVSDSAGQLGLVEDVNITINLQTSKGEIIPNISTKDLKRIREFSIGDYAILGPWLGRVDDVFDNVTVMFNDGSMCKIVKADPLRLKAVSKPVINDASSPFYPGQQVRAVSSSVFKNSRWLSGSWKAGRLEGTVTKVQTASVMVYWMTSAHFGAGTASDGVPSEEQDPKNLTLLSCFLHTNWQLGDWCFLRTSGNLDSFDHDSMTDDRVCEQVSALAQNSSAYRKKLRKVVFKRERKAGRTSENFERALLIVSIATKVDVTWQDGTRVNGLESMSLIPIRSESDHEFFPEQFVVEKSMNEVDDLAESNRVGIVKGVNSKERTVCVRWFKPVSSPNEPREIMCEEVVSVYELDEHPDYDYCYGDVVVRLSPALTESSSENVKEQHADFMESEPCALTKNLECHPDMLKSEAWAKLQSLSWVGNITGLQNGDVEVAWADGMISNISPQDIYVVGRDDDEESYEGGSELSDDGASWETVNENEMDMLGDTENEVDSQDTLSIPAENTQGSLPVSEDNVPEITGAFSASLAAINFVTRLATGLFTRNKKQSHASNSDHNDISDLKAKDAPEISIAGTNNADLGLSDRRTGDDVERVEDVLANGLVSIISDIEAELQGDIDGFRHFDVCDSPADHYFVSNHGQDAGGKKWVKKIQLEWSILEKNLPDAIYVRAYEDRMDLLRAVIVGASGTPYQDGLYFFDFYLPPEYPQVPPLAHYHSGGLRLNPNLYVDGKVCLSLLNTWAGRGNEVWDPSSSSILQVLVSLQGLVLNSKPYFNEAGYEKQVGTIEGEKNSIPYNENAYLMNLKSMMYLMRRPPLHFEGFVKKHFQWRGHCILKACEAYMGGSVIGTLSKDAGITEKSKEQVCSVGFRLMLSKVIPRLMAAMAGVGSDVRQFERLTNLDNRR